MAVTVDDVVARFELDDFSRSTLDVLAAIPTVGPPLPSVEQCRRLLDLLEVPEADSVEVLAAYPDPDTDAEIRWLAERCAAQLVATIGQPERIGSLWPNLRRRLGPSARCAYVWAFLATIPTLRAHHASHDVPDDVSWATLGDLRRQLSRHRRSAGMIGIDEQYWLNLAYTGRLYELGRLQFDKYAITAEEAEPGFAHRYVLDTHIPIAGPLLPDACDRSFAHARSFFPRHFPDFAATAFTCDSWLLDPQLADVLPTTSNIVQFQRRFELLEDPRHSYLSDNSVIYFVFGLRRVPPLDELPRRTTLEAAVVDHLAAGKHWYARVGWFGV